MNKKLVFLPILIMSFCFLIQSTSVFKKAGGWIKKEAKKAIHTVEDFGAKVEQAVAKVITDNKIIQLINEINNIKKRTKPMTNAIQGLIQTITSDTGFIKKGKAISTQIKYFENQAKNALKVVSSAELQKALVDEQEQAKVLNKLGKEGKRLVNNIIKTHQNIVDDIKSMEIKPFVQNSVSFMDNINAILYQVQKASKTLDMHLPVINKIINIIPKNFAQQLAPIRKDISQLSKDMAAIIPHKPITVEEVEKKLILGLLHNLVKIPKMVKALSNPIIIVASEAKGVLPNRIKSIEMYQDKMVNTAKSIKSRLKNAVIKPLKKNPLKIFLAAKYAAKELEKILWEIKFDLKNVLANSALLLQDLYTMTRLLGKGIITFNDLLGKDKPFPPESLKAISDTIQMLNVIAPKVQALAQTL